LTADSVVKEIHRRTLGIARSLPRHGNTPEIEKLKQKANFYAWWALDLKSTLGMDFQCVRTREEDLLDRLNSEYKRIKDNASLVFHLLPHDIHERYFEHFNQVHGTCTASCLQAAIETFAPRVFEEFRLNSLEKVYEIGIECRKDLLKLREELPPHGLEEFREKIDDLLYELYYSLGAANTAIEDSTFVASPAHASARRSLGELFRGEEPERDISLAALASPSTVAAVIASPMGTVVGSATLTDPAGIRCLTLDQ